MTSESKLMDGDKIGKKDATLKGRGSLNDEKWGPCYSCGKGSAGDLSDSRAEGHAGQGFGSTLWGRNPGS